MKKYFEQKWLTLQDEGWVVVIPDTDTQPHSTDRKKKERELAGIDCPCKPKIDVGAQMIVHNSFQDLERLENAMNKP